MQRDIVPALLELVDIRSLRKQRRGSAAVAFRVCGRVRCRNADSVHVALLPWSVEDSSPRGTISVRAHGSESAVRTRPDRRHRGRASTSFSGGTRCDPNRRPSKETVRKSEKPTEAMPALRAAKEARAASGPTSDHANSAR